MSFDTKKHRFGVFLVQLLRIVFSVFTRQIHSFFGYSPPVSGGGSEIGQICGVFSSKDSKMHIFLTFLNGYIHPNNFKNKKQAFGALPQTPLTCEAAGAGGKPYPPTPTVSVVDSKASRVKCTTSSPLTPLHLRGGSKTNRSGRSWKPVKACEATA